uniref:Uncharacterized protein n=1 Tax=Rhizophora mucronata TaxID=61149 RepID=A0A2P2JS91_RHIMU
MMAAAMMTLMMRMVMIVWALMGRHFGRTTAGML